VEVVDEVEEGRLGPVQVVEDDDDRRKRFEQAPDRPVDVAALRSNGAEADRTDDRVRRLLTEEPHQLLARIGAADLLHDLAQRPVRDAVAVRQTAADEHARVARRPHELAHEPRLADAGSMPSSRSRPTNGASTRRVKAGESGRTSSSRYAGTGLAFPFSSSGSTASARTAAATSR
jgi:hypothetical protein